MAVIKSIITSGNEGFVIDVECRISNNLPSIVIVGLVGKAIDESKERVRGAFASAKLQLPVKRITVNLAPADLPKESTCLDLAVAAAILQANNQITLQGLDQTAIIGELGLDGDVRPVRGIIGKIIAAKKHGVDSFIVPSGNLEQALLVPGVTIRTVGSLGDFYRYVNNELALPCHMKDLSTAHVATSVSDSKLQDIVGQPQAKRALRIAAAGGHNIFLYGPPGTGKSMLAKALVGLLPPLSHSEVLEATHLHSLASPYYDVLITRRPLRSPHHSTSHVALVGGGTKALPGDITLSHRGVLLLDEMPEFSASALEALRQPLEDKMVTVSRARHTVTYPADFILVGTANPCPCGYRGSDQECSCTVAQISRYRRKLSGPIMDRIDLYVFVETVNHADLLQRRPDSNEDRDAIEAVAAAREKQHRRLGPDTLNAVMQNVHIRQYADLSQKAKQILDTAASAMHLSARGYMRTIKVARTIADLEDSASIDVMHITEALQYRNPLGMDM